MVHDYKDFQLDSKKDLPIFIKWMDFLKWLFVTLDGFPKKARFNFADRITSLSLQIVEDLVEARYSRNKDQVLRRVNINLEKIRILMRICFELRFLSSKSYEHASFLINEIGKMLGGWMKQQQDDHEKIR
jgi:hypothetical protein